MILAELRQLIEKHTGIFYCRGCSHHNENKHINFKHVYQKPGYTSCVLDIGDLRDFYSTFGSLTLYYDEKSGDAAFYIAKPEEWGGLLECFNNWMEDVTDDNPEWLPYWVGNCIAIGEIPESGNYLLVPLSGDKKGHVFEFEHDGYEFKEYGSSVEEFIRKALKPDSELLTDMASHMTFTENDPMDQWWIEEMHDNKGLIVKTFT